MVNIFFFKKKKLKKKKKGAEADYCQRDGILFPAKKNCTFGCEPLNVAGFIICCNDRNGTCSEYGPRIPEKKSTICKRGTYQCYGIL